MKNFHIIILTLSCFLLSTPVLAKTYFCGASGTLIQSDKPCQIPETDWAIKPVTSDSLNKEVVNRTVEMFREATLTKDIFAIERFLSDDFTFVSHDKSWSGRVIFNTDKDGFVSLMSEHLLAMTSYEQFVENYSVKTIGGQLVAETTSFEKASLGKKRIEAKVLEQIRLKLVGKKVKIRSIKQIEL